MFFRPSDDTVGEADLSMSAADVAPTLAVRGFVRSLASDEAGALADANEAVHGLPDAAETYLMRSIVRFLLRDYEGAIADGDEALRLAAGRNQDYLENLVYANRGRARVFSGGPEGAAKDFAEATRRESAVRSTRAFNMLVFLPVNAQAGQH